MKLVSDYLDQYQKLHDGVEGYIDCGQVKGPSGGLFTGANFASKLIKHFDVLMEYRVGSVRILDYGCGKAKHLYEPRFNGQTFYQAYEGKVQTYYCYDPGYKKYMQPPHPAQKFDIVICADVMEHIPGLSFINHALMMMAGHLESDGVALFTISGKKAKKQFLDGENLHVSLYPVETWVAWLEDAFCDKAVMMIYEGEDRETFWCNDAYRRITRSL